MAAFEELGVMPELIRGIEDLDWMCEYIPPMHILK